MSNCNILPWCVPGLNNWKYNEHVANLKSEFNKTPIHTLESIERDTLAFRNWHRIGTYVQGVVGTVMTVALLAFPFLRWPLLLATAGTFFNIYYSRKLYKKDLMEVSNLKTTTVFDTYVEALLQQNQTKKALEEVTRRGWYFDLEKIANVALANEDYDTLFQTEHRVYQGFRKLYENHKLNLALQLLEKYKNKRLPFGSIIEYLIEIENFDLAEKIGQQYYPDHSALKRIPVLRTVESKIEEALRSNTEEEQIAALNKVLLLFEKGKEKPGPTGGMVSHHELTMLRKVGKKLIEKEKFILVFKISQPYCTYSEYLDMLIKCLDKVVQKGDYTQAFNIAQLSANPHICYKELVKLICKLEDPNFEKAFEAATNSRDRLNQVREHLLPALIAKGKTELALVFVSRLEARTWDHEQERGTLRLVELFCKAVPPLLEEAKRAYKNLLLDTYERSIAAGLIKEVDPSFDH